MYTRFSELVRILKIKKIKLIMEDRVGQRMKCYGIVNHAETAHYRNPYDRDLWDVIIPGYKCKIEEKEFYSNDIIGVLFLENGNHKIFMRVNHPGYSKKRAEKDMKSYMDEYIKHHDIYAVWLEDIYCE